MLVRLRTRLDAIERSALDDARPLPGPDPRPAPWQAWITNLSAVERFGTQSARAAALLAPGNDVERLERAVTIARSSPRRVLLGQALLALGRMRRHFGQRRTGRAVLCEALALAERLRCAPLATQARDELRLAGARPRRKALSGPASLTPRGAPRRKRSRGGMEQPRDRHPPLSLTQDRRDAPGSHLRKLTSDRATN